MLEHIEHVEHTFQGGWLNSDIVLWFEEYAREDLTSTWLAPKLVNKGLHWVSNTFC